MALIRLNLRNLSMPAKIAKGRQIVTALTDKNECRWPKIKAAGAGSCEY